MMRAFIWCVFGDLNFGCSVLVIFEDFAKAMALCVSPLVEALLLGRVLHFQPRKASWHSNCECRSSVAGLRFSKFFLTGVIS